jgi:hypothetical protein
VKKDEKSDSEAKSTKEKVPKRLPRSIEKKSRELKRMSVEFDRSFIDIRITPNEAIEDLHKKLHPKIPRWHETLYIVFHLFFAAILTAIYFVVAFPLSLIVIPNFTVINALLTIFLGGAFVFIVSLFVMRRYYYWDAKNSIKIKKDPTKGVSLGTTYEHYINTLHYSSFGNLDTPKDKPQMAGETKEFVLDYTGESNPHAIILGGSGSGKTTTLRAFLIRSYLTYGLKFLIIDWNGESEGWATKINATVWKAGKHFKINPFMLRDASIADRAGSVAELFQFGARMTPLQSNMIRTLVLKHYQKGETPTLIDIWKDIDGIANSREQTSQKRDYAEWIDQRLRTVQRVFGTEPEEFWEGMLTRNNIISLAGLNESEKSIVAYAVFQRIVEFFNRKPELNQKTRMMLVLDEAWAVLQSQKQGDQMYESLPSRIVRLGRKYGFGMIVSTQQIEDIPQAFINSSAIRIIHSYRTENFLDSAKKTFGLGDFESAYLGTAGIGEGFVFDQNRAQNGQNFGDYVKVRPLEDTELQKVRETEKAYLPQILKEPELPIDTAGGVTEPVIEKPKTEHWPPPEDRPTPTQYAGLLTIFNNPGNKKSELAKLIKEDGIVTSANTIYGYSGRPGIFETLVKMKFAEENDDVFSLTESGLRWVDPSRILEPDKDRIGSTMHERILIQTIKELQKKHMLVVVPEPEGEDELGECIDLIAYPIDPKRKYLWDDSKRKGYEIQTTARNEVTSGHAERASRYGVPLTWVSSDPDVLDAIKKIRGEKDEYLLVRL